MILQNFSLVTCAPGLSQLSVRKRLWITKFVSQGRKTMTGTDVTGFDAIFSTGFSLLSPDFRGLVLLNCTQTLEKKQKIQWRASSGDGAPKLQISVPGHGRTCPEFRLEFISVIVRPQVTESNSLRSFWSVMFAVTMVCGLFEPSEQWNRTTPSTVRGTTPSRTRTKRFFPGRALTPLPSWFGSRKSIPKYTLSFHIRY